MSTLHSRIVEFLEMRDTSVLPHEITDDERAQSAHAICNLIDADAAETHVSGPWVFAESLWGQPWVANEWPCLVAFGRMYAADPAPPPAQDAPGAALGTRFTIEHDGFAGTVIGHYERLDGKRGVVMQQDGTKVVHVYGEKWLKPIAALDPSPPLPEADGKVVADDTADMAAIGLSFMASLETVTSLDGPFKGWTPAEDPAELVLDLYNALVEPTEEREKLAARLRGPAMDSAKRFINQHFRNGGERPRASIPAQPDRDDDLVLVAALTEAAEFLSPSPAKPMKETGDAAESVEPTRAHDPDDRPVVVPDGQF